MHICLFVPAGKGLTSWLSFVVYNCELVKLTRISAKISKNHARIVIKNIIRYHPLCFPEHNTKPKELSTPNVIGRYISIRRMQ